MGNGTKVWVVTVAVALALSLSGAATAGTCDAEDPCKCGDNVVGKVTLAADLVGCERVGLRMTPNAELDCQGHSIEGVGTAKSTYGIRLDKVHDAVVRNCHVTKFKRGIRLRGGERNRILDNIVEGNTIGIEIAGGTASGIASDHLIRGNHAGANEQDGIHLGDGTVRAKVRHNKIIKTGQEGMYLLWCVDCEVTDNLIEGAGTSAIYHKHTSGAYYARNTIRGSIFHVRGESSGNLFAHNTLEGSGYVFDGYTSRGYAQDPGWVRIPHDNEIVGGSIRGKYCFRFHGSSRNRARHVVAHHCKPVNSRAYDGVEPSDNVLHLHQVTTDFDDDLIANVSDPCTDLDADGFGDPGFEANVCATDNCLEVPNPDQSDADDDGFGDACDLCPLTFDPAQRDRDRDGIGDACDPCNDVDGDGFGTLGGTCPHDNCAEIPNPDQSDRDLDGVGDVCDRCPSVPDPEQSGPTACDVPVPVGLEAAERQRYLEGIGAFTRVETPATGLGPAFNGASCAECHSHPTAGGSSNRTVTLFGRNEAGGFDPMHALGGPLLQAQSIRTPDCSLQHEATPKNAVPRRRQTPPLYGVGLIDTIPAEAILAHADPDDLDRDGISGRANRLGGGVGRFGWKAEQLDLRAFIEKALVEEMGITNPRRPEEERPQGRVSPCDPVADPEDDGTRVRLLHEFLQKLPPPSAVRGEDVRPVPGGAELFEASGCASCHVPSLPAGENALGATQVPLYSDLLLHDLGPSLGDGVEALLAGPNEFRTTPLWGVAQSGPYLHDGRADTIEKAIGLHEGEATASRDRFLALPQSKRDQLVAFLETL